MNNKKFQVVAIIATYNEELFIQNCIEHYTNHGVDVFILDNESTDSTLDIVRSYLGSGVIGIESFPRQGMFSLKEQLKHKERLARQLDADWIIHADADEIRLPPVSTQTLSSALLDVQESGYNAVNFLEFTFVPTQEEPEHEHSNYQETMLRYYHFGPRHPFHIKAWRPKELNDFEIASTGGHLLSSKDISLCPIDFKFKHYLYLSKRHWQRKYAQKVFSSIEVNEGWHGWRANIKEGRFDLPSQNLLLPFLGDDELDSSKPQTHHFTGRRIN